MPTVPRLNPQRLQTQAIPGARVSTDAPIEAFGGGQSLDNVVNTATNELNKYAADERQKANDVVTQDVYAKAVNKKNEYLYDPKSGALAKTGKNAFGVIDEYNQKFNKDMSDLENSLANDDQKEIARKIISQQSVDLNEALHRHVLSETKQVDSQVVKGALESSMNDAILNYSDPAKVDLNVGLQKKIIMSNADRNGLPAEMVKAQIEDAQSNTYMGVINRMLANGQDVLAKTTYDKVKGQISGKDVVAVEKALDEGTLRGESQRQSDAILLKTSNLMDALEMARKITDPKTRDATTLRIKEYGQSVQQAKNLDKEKTFQDASNIIEKNPNVRNIPPSMWEKFTISEKSSLEKRAAHLASGAPEETNWTTYYELMNQATSDVERKKFLATDLLTKRHELADSEFKELTHLQASLKKGDENAVAGYRTITQIVDGSLAGIWDIKPSASKKDKEKVEFFRNEVNAQIYQWRESTGKKVVPPEEIQKIVDRLLTQRVVQKGYVWDSKKRTIEIGETDIQINEVPKPAYNLIADSLKRQNRPVTDAAIIKFYVQGLKRGINAK